MTNTPTPTPETPPTRGILTWFAGSPVASNLLMFVIIVAGIISLMTIKIEVFPEFSTDVITVTVPYLGASPEEVEEGVCLRLEEAVSSVEGIERMTATASEGVGSLMLEVEDYADTREVLEDVKTEVDRIDTFPKETERPIVVEASSRRQVINLMLHGTIDEHSLKNLAERIRDELTGLPTISQVELAGLRENEIAIEVSEETLRRHNLRFDEIAQLVSASSLDLPGGSIETKGGDILVRTKGQKYRGDDFNDIVVMTRTDGTRVFLEDIATIVDGFEDSDKLLRFNGQPAAQIAVYRVGNQGAIDVADTVHNYMVEKQAQLPAGVHLSAWLDRSEYLNSRMELLIKNAMIGLALVFFSLSVFLDLRLAFWTTMGIVISFVGSFWLLPLFGVSINMISLFAFIVVLGIVVDDAIVVGENIFDYRVKGHGPAESAVLGVRELWLPVTIAVLTTVAAFAPLLHVSGTMGKIFRNIPIVVISVLTLSLVDALLILPAHMSHGRVRSTPGLIARGQQRIRCLLEAFINGPFSWMVRLAARWRYATIALCTAMLIITVGYIIGGHIRFVFFPNVEADYMSADVTVPQGTPTNELQRVIRQLENAALTVRDRYDRNHPDLDRSVFKHLSTSIGSRVSRGPNASAGGQANTAQIMIELIPGEQRDLSTKEFSRQWRKATGEIPGVSSLSFTANLFDAGKAIYVEVGHTNWNTLLRAVEQLKTTINGYDGVTEITDNFEPGKYEIKLSLKPEARPLGLTLADLARQVRQAFYGHEAQRIQRGRNDIRVMVRYPESERDNLNTLETMRVRLPDGTEIPFHTVAQVELGRGYATIHRTDRRRMVAVTAEVDNKIANAEEINQELKKRVLPQLKAQFPGLVYDFQGEQREQNESISSLKRNFAIALFGIFALLALQFRSYAQPLIIMGAIPFGIIGAVIGHLIMGFDLSILSMFGIVALTGVVVNDSLILIDLVNRLCEQGIPPIEAVTQAAARRFRPIMLTTMTTFFGLMPMILETSLQARFLIPMAISLGFGVVIATIVTLILIPALYLVLEDVYKVATIQKDQ